VSGARVLLLGSHEWPALSVARSLGRAGYAVDTLRLVERRQPADFSRHVGASRWLGDPHGPFDAWAEDFVRFLADERYDLLFPINDVANEIVYNLPGGSLPESLTLIGPSRDAYLRAADKIEAAALFGGTSVSVPASTTLRRPEEVEGALESLEYPLYAKPARSALLVAGRIQTFRVSRVQGVDQLLQKLSEDLPRVALSLQQPLEGHGVGVNLCARQGRVIALSQNERLHEPRGGGGSSYRRNVLVAPELAEVAKRVAAELTWTGLMMIELKWAEGRWWFMELNCRPWGSIETAIRSGVDFPRLAVETALGHPTPQPEPLTSSRATHVRNLKKDLKWVTLRALHSSSRVGDVARWLGGFARLLTGRESWDVESLRDPMPALTQFNNDLADLRERVSGRLRRAALGGRPRPAVEVSRDDRLLFVCAGNINRSAVAEYLAVARGFTRTGSAGTLVQSGRGASPGATAFLEGEGIDASRHRSRHAFDPEVDLEGADWIVVFDRRNWDEVSRRRAELVQRLVYLEQITEKEIGDIDDPFGEDADRQLACFRAIRDALDAVRVRDAGEG